LEALVRRSGVFDSRGPSGFPARNGESPAGTSRQRKTRTLPGVRRQAPDCPSSPYSGPRPWVYPASRPGGPGQFLAAWFLPVVSSLPPLSRLRQPGGHVLVRSHDMFTGKTVARTAHGQPALCSTLPDRARRPFLPARPALAATAAILPVVIGAPSAGYAAGIDP